MISMASFAAALIFGTFFSEHPRNRQHRTGVPGENYTRNGHKVSFFPLAKTCAVAPPAPQFWGEWNVSPKIGGPGGFSKKAQIYDRDQYIYAHSYIRGEQCIFRYDNAPYHPEIIPHHKHIGESKLAPADQPAIQQILAEIEAYLTR